MIKRINILVLLMLTLGISISGMSFAATSQISITSQYTTYPAGTTSITFTATTTVVANEVTFYYGTSSTDVGNYLGTVSSSCSTAPCTFAYTWDNVPPSGGEFYVDAIIGSGSSAGTGTSNGVIDMVADLNSATVNGAKAIMPDQVNPALDPSFGAEPTFSSCAPATDSWIGGDDQMCLTAYPYNGSSSADPYGTCEWTGGSGSGSKSIKNQVPGSNAMTFCGNPPTPQMTAASTVDSLDETMHILSHFDIFAQNILNKNLGTINSTFDSWYSQAAGWIAPACASSCAGNTFSNQTCTPGFPNPCNPYCQSSVSTSTSDTTCNQGGPGRLLSIYDPAGYPGLPNVVANTLVTGAVDELNGWKTVMTNWLNTSYTPTGATSADLWCVPTESTDLEISQSGVYIPTTEDFYIRSNAPTPVWGDLSHVIACLNYNAGSTPAGSVSNTPNLQACLTALTSGTCPAQLPYQCTSDPLSLWGTGAAPADNCDPYYVDQSTGTQSYANWVNSQVNFGAANSYSACLNALTSGTACTAKGDTLPEACEPWILGRNLLSSSKEAKPAFPEPPASVCTEGRLGETCTNKDITCDPTYSDSSGNPSFAKWVKDSMTLFLDEQPKFALRSAFLTDAYNRAQTMQNIFAQGDTALHNFFKPCIGYCADGSACPISGSNTGRCDDGSLCGPPSCGAGGTCQSNGTCSDPGGGKCNYCANGGPAAQLIYAKGLANPVRQLPNSVIYGWVDQTLPNGQTLPGTPPGQPGGYAHIVKVTAYAPGRDANGPPGVQSVLPWINSWNTFLYQYYTLANRDGDVYVSVQRWDQDHANATTFPNGHALWQFLFHNPSTPPAASIGNNLLQVCSAGTYGGLVQPYTVGFGLQNLTVQGFLNQTPSAFSNTSDKAALPNAFMLNDNGDGTVDPNADPNTSGQTCESGKNGSAYCQCLSQVITLLGSGVESHACARYTADVNGDDPSGTQDKDYSLKFIDCNSMEQGAVPASSP